MNVTLLNTRIQIQKTVVVTDEIGNHKNEWVDYFSCYATVSGERGSEVHKVGETLESVSIAFTIRYSSETEVITPTTHRVIFNDEIYNITNVDHMNFKRKCLKLSCEKERR